ncbi:hypothetical protein PYCCODRAFT_1429912 [Trametes coccinea BRFM310]|uniref:Uncharacterized protein n=1 Tax=Trametes coccinea (strain BRFM310) TaxID=1353009 RepID=A0A1Y2J465_TRAC3|nr:hypothetical protein PYCCODRAFT_1429912 [Trametes coccinea BRFM310]
MSLAVRNALASTARPCRLRRPFKRCLIAATRNLSTPAPPHELSPLPESAPLNFDPALLSAFASTFPPDPHLLKLSITPQPGGKGPKPEQQHELSDQEWEIRTGRAIYVLQQTLPSFFSTGLVSSVDTSPAISRPSVALTSPDDDDTSIYSPNIRLVYRPPTPFPPPFPRTLHVEGLSLYLASSAILRHTLNALYTDLYVELQRVRVHGPRSSSTSGLSADRPDPDDPVDGPRQQGKTRSIREKSLFIGLTVRGINRVSKAESSWAVNQTYTFSPVTGLIHLHNIDSIHPAPHQAFFDALQAALSKIGLGGSQGEGAGGVARTSVPESVSRVQLGHVASRS